MSLWRQLRHGMRALLDRRAADRDTADEVQHYLEQATRENLASGMAPEAARRAARIELGSVAAVHEQVRGYGWENTVGTLLADVRYALRLLQRSPGFAAVAIAVIALGTGAVTTIFSAMNAIVLRPLPGAANAERLVSIDRGRPDEDDGVLASWDYVEFLRANADTLEGIAAWTNAPFTIATAGEGTMAYGNIVSGNYFALLGVQPALGRFFLAEEDRTPLTHPVLVLSHALWRSKFAGDSGVIGREVMVNGQPYTIIGVAPPQFHGVFTPLRPDAWVPLMMQPHLRPRRDLEHASWLRTFGRLRPGASVVAGQEELSALTARYVVTGGEPPARREFDSVRLSGMNGLPADARTMALGFIGLLFGASLLVLLIASVNIASMLGARAVVRGRELAVRAALGAGRLRLIRQLTTEVVVLFVCGASGGVVLTWLATSALEKMPIPVDVPLTLEVSPDIRVFAFALGIALLSGIAFGLGPALRGADGDVGTRLREGTSGAGSRRRVFSKALMVGQLSLSLLLLVAAGLFLRAVDHGASVDPGFDLEGVATTSLNTESWGYDGEQGRAFYDALRDRVEALPAVTAVSSTNSMPLAFAIGGGRVQPENTGVELRDGGEPIQLALVDPGYFDVLRLPLRTGRAIDATDVAAAPRVAVVNETFARRFWPEDSALGRIFEYQGERVAIVGIAADAKYESLSEVTPAFAYFPMAQHWIPNQVLLVRTAADLESLGAAMQEAVLAIDPSLPRPAILSLRQASSVVLLPQRIAAWVTGTLGAIGLLLATVGLYGNIVYGVNRRTREIGLRVALGARRQDVVLLVVGEGMRLAILGVALGLVLAAVVTRLLESLLLGVSPVDATTFAVMGALFVGTAWLASYLPARRAAAADPMAALRLD